MRGLPEDLSVEVLTFLDLKEAVRSSVVSNRFLQLVSVFTLGLDYLGTQLHGKHVPHFGKFSNIYALKIDHSPFVSSLQYLYSCMKLRAVSLKHLPMITDISVVSQLPGLEYLDICGLSICSLDFVENCPSLKTLKITDCENVKSFPILTKTARNLVYLSLRQTKSRLVESVEKLAVLVNLETLVLDHVLLPYESLLDLCLPRLKKATILWCDIHSLDWLRHSASTLEIVSVKFNENLTDLKGLELCSNLREVDVSQNNINNIAALTNKRQMYALDISSNQIHLSSHLLPLSSCSLLDTLIVEDSGIFDIAVLGGLEQLRFLHASHNYFQRLPTLPHLEGLEVNFCFCLEDFSQLRFSPKLKYLHMKNAYNAKGDLGGLLSSCKFIQDLDFSNSNPHIMDQVQEMLFLENFKNISIKI